MALFDVLFGKSPTEKALDRIEARLTTIEQRLAAIELWQRITSGRITGIANQTEAIMATVQEVAALAVTIRDAVTPLPELVNALEEAIRNAGMSEADRAAVNSAFEDLTSALGTIRAAVTDAQDGTDGPSDQPAPEPAPEA